MNKSKLALLGLSVLALAGCSQDEALVGGTAGNYTGVVEQSVATKSYSNEKGEFKWAQGDNIAVYVTETGAADGFTTVTMKGGADTEVASYGAISGLPKDVAVFPVSAAKSYDPATKKVTVTYPAAYAETNYTADYDNEKDKMIVNDPLVATYGKGVSQFVFRHVGGVIEWKVQVPAKTDEFTVTMNSGVTGDFTVDATGDAAPTATAKEGATENTVSFTFPAVEEATTMHFYMPVPTGTYAGCTIAVKAGGTQTNELTSDATNTVKRCGWVVMPFVNFVDYSGVIENTVSSLDELFTALSEGKTEITLAEGTYTLNSSNASKWSDAFKNKTVKISGADKTKAVLKMEFADKGETVYTAQGATVTFNNMSIDMNAAQNFQSFRFDEETFTNCIFNGAYEVYSPKATYDGCTFNQTGDAYALWQYAGAKNVLVKNCTFNTGVTLSSGKTKNKAILVYPAGDPMETDKWTKKCELNLTVQDCKFFGKADESGKSVDDKSAIELHTESGLYGTLTLLGTNTATGFAEREGNPGKQLWIEKDNVSSGEPLTTYFTITENGKTIQTSTVK